MLTRLFARRYLFSRNARSVINIISGVSVVAIAVPVGAMIILLSVFNGFESLIRDMRSAYDADLTITPSKGASFIIADMPVDRIAAVGGVEAYSFAIEQGALLAYGDNRATAIVRGADENYADVVPADETVVSGRFEVQLGEDVDKIVLGQGLAHTLGVRSFVIDDVRIYALRRHSFSTLLPTDGFATVALPVAAIFRLDAETDGRNALTSLRAAQKLFDYPDRATALLVKTDGRRSLAAMKRDVEQALEDAAKQATQGTEQALAGDAAQTSGEAKQDTAQTTGNAFTVTTRDEKNATMYRIMRYEKWGIFLIATMVLVIASLSIVGALAMLIIEKRRDIAALRAMGADTKLIRAIFTSEGMLISGIGGAAGLALGVVLSLVQQCFGIITIPAETLLVDVYPVELHLADVAVTAATFILVARCISALTVRTMITKDSTI